MKIDSLLRLSRPSMLIIEERDNRKIVVGVPHHAPAGIGTLPCPSHPMSDENAGCLGLFLAKKLNCCSIIACNYMTDVNKCMQSDYSMQVARWSPDILVEIHGHSGKNVGLKAIEISSGSTCNKFSRTLAKELTTALSNAKQFRNISVTGDFQRLYFKATSSVTITDPRWTAYHIELPPCIRKRKTAQGGRPPQLGYAFCNSLADALERLHKIKIR